MSTGTGSVVFDEWRREEQPDDTDNDGVAIGIEVLADGRNREGLCRICPGWPDEYGERITLEFDALGHLHPNLEITIGVSSFQDCMADCFGSDGNEESGTGTCCPDEADPTDCVPCFTVSRLHLKFDALGHLYAAYDRCNNELWHRDELIRLDELGQPDARDGFQCQVILILPNDEEETGTGTGTCGEERCLVKRYIVYIKEMVWDALGHLSRVTRSVLLEWEEFPDCCCDVGGFTFIFVCICEGSFTDGEAVIVDVPLVNINIEPGCTKRYTYSGGSSDHAMCEKDNIPHSSCFQPETITVECGSTIEPPNWNVLVSGTPSFSFPMSIECCNQLPVSHFFIKEAEPGVGISGTVTVFSY